ncbi:alpha/beta hydrolase [Ferrimonas sediminicola]|uniref:Alpha/beta hydrolase n=1 Tax=Ferrimonas sediminicola TaxID=2569538 RepID=A0A4U1BD68_9GAMM|nr:alpha/beta hydrolase [Ferrimonas sediminicola]TKB48506.1 alpha/beta hydrolase [Ferrimonas sediminicola]
MTTESDPRERRFQLENLSLAALEWGPPQGPLILALHGWMDNAHSFVPLAPALAAMGYRVLAPEFPGHGHSDHRPVGNYYHFLDYLYDLHQLWPQLDETPALLLGHSMGGILAGLFASLYPERVSRLAIIEAMGPLTAEPGDSLARMRAGFVSRDKGFRPQGYPDLAPLVKARAAAGGLDESLARLLLERNLKQRDGLWHWRSDPRLRTRSPWMMTEAQGQQLMSDLQADTLVVLGEAGFDGLREAWPERRGWLNQPRLKQIGGGHHCHMESPRELAALLERFIGVKSSEHTNLG